MDKQHLTNSEHLAKLILDMGIPANDASTALLPQKLTVSGMSRTGLADALGDLVPKITKSTAIADIESHRKAAELILMGTLAAAFDFKNLALGTRQDNFVEDTHLGRMGLTRRIVERVIPVLIDEGWIRETLKGYKASSSGAIAAKSSQYFAGERLLLQFGSCLYDIEDTMYITSYHRFNEFESQPDKSIYQANEALLHRYNHFMADHTWAKKNPSTRAFSQAMDRAGRINNKFQNLANRRVPIRKSTLIDGYAIAEPDFSCNHLRMASAIVGEQLPADPYQEVATQLGLPEAYGRGWVKQVLTRCLGSASLRQRGGSMKRLALDTQGAQQITTNTFQAIQAATESLYPWTRKERLFFNDVGAHMQKLEGDIALLMIEWALDQEIPLLAVHDSFAVRKQDEQATDQAKDAAWEKVIRLATKQV
jgi:hypothetical protein